MLCIIENILAPNLSDVGSGFFIKVDGRLYWIASASFLFLDCSKRSSAIPSGRLLRNDSSSCWEKVNGAINAIEIRVV